MDTVRRPSGCRRGFIQHQWDFNDDRAPAGPSAYLLTVFVAAVYIHRQVPITVKHSVPGVVVVQPPIELIDRDGMRMQFVLAVVMEQQSARNTRAQNQNRQQRYDTQQCAQAPARPVRFRASSGHCLDSDPRPAPVKPKDRELTTR